MNPEAIAQLRTESLAATLCAARQRRVRRRAITVLGCAAVCSLLAIAILPMREVQRVSATISRPAPTLEQAASQTASTARIRTNAHSVTRISTVSNIAHIRVSTAPAMRVERIDRDDLHAWFPGSGIAFIQQEAGPTGFVVF